MPQRGNGRRRRVHLARCQRANAGRNRCICGGRRGSGCRGVLLEPRLQGFDPIEFFPWEDVAPEVAVVDGVLIAPAARVEEV